MSLMEIDTEPNVKKRARLNDDDSLSERGQGNEEDRLSDLPDCVLTHLMTFMTTKDSVRTGVLSTRYKDLWKRVPSLVLDSRNFGTLAVFDKLVPQVLSLRDGSVPLQSLDFYRNGRTPPRLLRRVVRYAVSHSSQHLKLTANCDIDLPQCLFSCQSLTSLDLSVSGRYPPLLFPKSLNLIALKSLRVGNFAFCAGDSELVEPFSSCVKLETLVIHRFVVSNKQIFCISNATLVNLTICGSLFFEEEAAYRIVLSTPNLCSFTFTCVIAQQITASDLSSLKEVNIDVDHREPWQHLRSAFILISWLQVFANIRSLTVCSSTLKVLSLIPNLLNTESPRLDNLKSLTVNVKKHSSWKPRRAAKSKKAQLAPPSCIPDGVVDYLIRNSPLAKVTIKC